MYRFYTCKKVFLVIEKKKIFEKKVFEKKKYLKTKIFNWLLFINKENDTYFCLLCTRNEKNAI